MNEDRRSGAALPLKWIFVMQRSKVSINRLRLVAVASACAWLSAAAQTSFKWTGGEGTGNWSDAGNWEAVGAPVHGYPATSSDKAVFEAEEAPLTVSFSEDVENDSIEIAPGADLTLDIGGANTYFLTNDLVIGSGTAHTSSLRIASGFIDLHRPARNNILALPATTSKGAKVDITVAGEGTKFWSNRRLELGSNANTEGTIHVLDGAELDVEQLRVGSSGTGYLLVSNGVFCVYRHWLTLGYSANSYGEARIVGERTAVKPSVRFGSTGYTQIHVGGGGTGVLHVGPGLNLNYLSFLHIGNLGKNGNGTVNITGSTLKLRTISSGALLGGEVTGVVPGTTPADAGVGEVNILDGSFITLIGYNRRALYIGPGSTLRLRDSRIDMTDNNVLWMREGSRLAIELTENSLDSFGPDDPMIHSEAIDEPNITSVIDGAVLEITLSGSYRHVPGKVFHIFRYAGELQGLFAGLPDESDFYLGEERFSIHYGSLNGDAITLRAEAPPGTMLLVR